MLILIINEQTPRALCAPRKRIYYTAFGNLNTPNLRLSAFICGYLNTV